MQKTYPYLPENRRISVVTSDNSYILKAKQYAKEHSLDAVMPTGAVIVQQNVVIGIAANGSSYHQTDGCERVRRGSKTGEDYELCEGCHPKNHAEAKAVENAIENCHNTQGADLYLWGHWWCCKSCWDKMIEAGIRDVYLVAGSEVFFNKENPDNIVGRQFESIG